MQERKINQSNAMQCFKASDGSSNSSRRARAAEEMPISEEDIPAAMDAVKKSQKINHAPSEIHVKTILLRFSSSCRPQVATWGNATSESKEQLSPVQGKNLNFRKRFCAW